MIVSADEYVFGWHLNWTDDEMKKTKKKKKKIDTKEKRNMKTCFAVFCVFISYLFLIKDHKLAEDA